MNIAEYKTVEDMKKSILVAGGLHLLILLFLYSAAKFHWLPALSAVNPLSPEVKMLQTAVRVDVVSMPTQTLKEMKNEEIAPPPENVEKAMEQAKAQEKEAPVKEEKEVEPTSETPEFKKVGKKDFASLLKNLSQKEVKGSKSGKKSKAPMLSKEEINGLIIAGNKIAKGNALSGSSENVDEGAFAMYVSALPFRVKQFWKLPSYLLGKNLKCRVRVYISTNGELIKASIFESSGVDEYDQRALEAVEASSPFAVPDAAFAGRLSRGEIALGFPL